MKIVVYARVSSPGQNLEPQLEDIRRYITFKQHDVIHIYSEKESAKSIKERPEFIKMMADLEVNPLGIEGVVIWKLDRIGRSVIDLLNIVKFFKEHNIELISITNNIDTSTKEGRLFFAIMAGLSEYEREVILERTNLGKKYALERGVKFGRKKKDINLSEVMRKKLAGVPISRIAKDLKISRETLYKRLGEQVAE
jgi:DNA invertase Pin-like site-specific DNA recombinase